jgi:dolichol kinase
LRGADYNRHGRKVIHTLGGLLALLLPYLPVWASFIGAIAALGIVYRLKPDAAPWLYAISKPEDRASGRISGLCGYAAVLVVLLACLLLLGQHEPLGLRYVMFGWMALAFGDGLAGLLGPGPQVARTTPWNRHKTWLGVLGSFIGFCLAYLMCFTLPLHGLELNPPGHLYLRMLAVATGAALLESLDLPVDDNYVVGLTTPLLAWLVNACG